MVREILTIRSSISASFMKSTLLKGFMTALLGVTGLLCGGIFLPLSTLKTWGFALFTVSLGLITIGLLPYRKLSRLQLHPNQLTNENGCALVYHANGKKIFTLPFNLISEMRYFSNTREYGIGVYLTNFSLHVATIECLQEFNRLKEKGERWGCSLFFPYFSQQAYYELREWLYEEDD